MRSRLYDYMPLLTSHDSVLLQQKGTEVSVTRIIGHVIDIKYNHTFNIYIYIYIYILYIDIS